MTTHATHNWPLAISAAMSLYLAAAATGQTFTLVDCSGVSIGSLSTNPPDVVRTGTATTSIAEGYRFSFNPVVSGTGILGSVVGSNRLLGDVLNGFVYGQHRILYGAVRNPGGGLPVTLDREEVGGTFSGITVSLTLDYIVRADRTGQVAIRNIQKPFGLGLTVNSGGLKCDAWTPPPAVKSEWHFDGDLLSVKESGLATSSGPALIRYLDDSRFGTILGGVGNENNPDSATPFNITDAQSSFGTTSSFGIPAIGGEDDVVYRTSPPRNAAEPTVSARSRGLGLALWPNTRDFWPDDKNGQWTMVWDILIPTAAWNSEYVAPLIQDNHNNDGTADGFLRKNGASLTFGYTQAVASYPVLSGVTANQWFRLAISSDGYRGKIGRVFLNGVFVGTTGGDWVYNSCKSTAPCYGDVSEANPTGTPVNPTVWSGWGSFPSPWAKSPNTAAAPMAATIPLFADLLGQGEAIYVANFMYSDEAMTDVQIAAFGGPNGRGIAYLRPIPCPPDFNGDQVVDFFDYLDFVDAFSANNPNADFNNDSVIDFFDYLDFVDAFSVGC